MRTSPGCGCCGGPPPPCKVNFRLLQCCKTPIAGATVTAALGAFSVSGTTDARGNVTLDITGGGPGSYTITSVHGGLTSVETDTLACGSSISLDGGCYVDAFVSDCCGYHVTGATVTVKGPAPSTATVGTATVVIGGPIGLEPSVAIPVPNAGSYTVSCDDPCVTDSPQTATVRHCSAADVGVVRFHQPSGPPTTLTDPLGNAIALTAGKGSHTYTIDLGSLPHYPGTGLFPGCEFVPPIAIDRYGAICDPPTAYDSTADVTLGFSAGRCGLFVIVPLCPGFNPLQCWNATLRANFDPGTDVSGGCDNIAVPLMASGEGGFGTGTGQCCPYVGEGTVNFAPTPSQVDNVCNFTNTSPMTRWLLTAIFGDSGVFTTT